MPDPGLPGLDDAVEHEDHDIPPDPYGPSGGTRLVGIAHVGITGSGTGCGGACRGEPGRSGPRSPAPPARSRLVSRGDGHRHPRDPAADLCRAGPLGPGRGAGAPRPVLEPARGADGRLPATDRPRPRRLHRHRARPRHGPAVGHRRDGGAVGRILHGHRRAGPVAGTVRDRLDGGRRALGDRDPHRGGGGVGVRGPVGGP
ncbi:hypothetical protein SDC9_122028 [bioreactor metagenome]|uniref:Uncharacterized protein n=1 Tax=bioreactor metagenome TaxID=1076179 RepID=A0A645CDL4_9ZZZZ